jgi:hypothetical protein
VAEGSWASLRKFQRPRGAPQSPERWEQPSAFGGREWLPQTPFWQISAPSIVLQSVLPNSCSLWRCHPISLHVIPLLIPIFWISPIHLILRFCTNQTSSPPQPSPTPPHPAPPRLYNPKYRCTRFESPESLYSLTSYQNSLRFLSAAIRESRDKRWSDE